MANTFFQFRQFMVQQEHCAMKVTTDSCLFGSWVANEIAGIVSMKNPGSPTLLDIGGGTGLLSLMIAQKNQLTIDAVEIDAASAEQAVQNMEGSPWHHSIRVIHKDILHFSPIKKYNFIISNPPFYENELSSPDAAKSRAHHSTSLQMEQLITVIKSALDSSGAFYLMLPVKRKKEVETYLRSSSLFLQKIVLVKQSIAHEPFRIFMGGSFVETGDPEISEMSIRNEKNQYSSEFITLLREYYLHL